MRVAIVTESFLPQVNGVSNSVRHVVDHLVRLGHEPLVIAPAPGGDHHDGVPVVRVRSVGLPGYRTFPIGIPDATVTRALTAFAPDVVHLASPFVLGAMGVRAARGLGIPTVAVYQTDVAGFARQYGVRAGGVVDRWVGRLHRRCDRTLVPSRASRRQLAALGVTDLHLWRRGVSELFTPERRDESLHSSWAPDGETVVGYVGRLAAEKQVRRLSGVAEVPGVKLVVVGDGPERRWLERRVPTATFTGMLTGNDLATAYASLDVFVHTGIAETFCQTVQEAQASGVAVVAPAAGGPLDLVDHDRTGLLWQPDRPGTLTLSVGALVEEPARRAALADAGRTEASTRTWGRVVENLVEEHYRAVVDGPERTARTAVA